MFADLHYDYASGRYAPVGDRLRELVEEIKLADELGLDVFGLGEHHREDYAVSVPEMVLAAAASVTKRIKLGSAVTVLSSSDPVRTYQHFATLDHLSQGRAEIIVGRGSFIESFPLFGHNLKDYDKLFDEKLELLLKINRTSGPISWAGSARPSLEGQLVLPRANGELPIWIAVGGTPASVQRAARLGLPLILAIIGGNPENFRPLVDFYNEEYARQGHPPQNRQLGVHAHTFIGDKEAIQRYYPYYAAQMNKIGRERGWMPFSPQQFDQSRGPSGALLMGSAEEVAEKIISFQKLFGLTRFMAHLDTGGPPHKEIMRSIELLGSKVAPIVRAATSS